MPFTLSVMPLKKKKAITDVFISIHFDWACIILSFTFTSVCRFSKERRKKNFLPSFWTTETLIIVRIIWLFLTHTLFMSCLVLTFAMREHFFSSSGFGCYLSYVSLLPYNFPLKIDTIMAIFTRKVREIAQFLLDFSVFS